MMPTSHRSGLAPTTVQTLRQMALQAAANAYAPFSGFRVGAALLIDDGREERISIGCNVENSSFRLTMCAEQSALAAAIAQYGPEIRLRAAAVANLNESASSPCGACRQTLHEFSVENTWIFFPGEQGSLEDAPLGDLLPLAFRLREQRE